MNRLSWARESPALMPGEHLAKRFEGRLPTRSAADNVPPRPVVVGLLQGSHEVEFRGGLASGPASVPDVLAGGRLKGTRHALAGVHDKPRSVLVRVESTAILVVVRQPRAEDLAQVHTDQVAHRVKPAGALPPRERVYEFAVQHLEVMQGVYRGHADIAGGVSIAIGRLGQQAQQDVVVAAVQRA